MNKLYEVFNYIYATRDVNSFVTLVENDMKQTAARESTVHCAVLALLDERFYNLSQRVEVTAVANHVVMKFVANGLFVFPKRVVCSEIYSGKNECVQWQDFVDVVDNWRKADKADKADKAESECLECDDIAYAYFLSMIDLVREMDEREHDVFWHFDYEGPGIGFDEPTETILEFVDEAIPKAQQFIDASLAHVDKAKH